MRRTTALLAGGLLLLPLYGFYGSSDEGGDVLSAHDSRGNIGTVYNLFDGRDHSIQISRLAPNGYVHWTYQHQDGFYEKAYAAGMDADGNLFIAGERRAHGAKYILILKYDPNGHLIGETIDDAYDCSGVSMGVDREWGVTVAGVCRYGQTHPARVLRYDGDLRLLWVDEYDGGGRNYVKGLSVDYQGGSSVTVETVYGNYRDGSFMTRTVMYDPDGRRIAVR